MHHTIERTTIRILLPIGLAALAIWTTVGHAADWKPERPIELIVPSVPGGAFDKTLRLIERIVRDLKLVEVPVTVVNKAGGGGNLALAYLQQRPRDGHSLMVNSIALLTNHIVGRSEQTYRDLTPVVTLFDEYVSTIVQAGSPLGNPKAMIEQLRKDPTNVSFGFCCALGGGNHLAAALLVKAIGGDMGKMKNVVFKGAGEVTTALLGGHIVAASNAASNALGPILAGKLQVVAVAAPERVGGPLKDVPTWKEYGHDVVLGQFRTVSGPAGMPPEHLRYWEQTLAKVVRSEAWQAELRRNMWNDSFKNSAETARYLDEQYRKLSAILTDVRLAKH